MAKRKKQIPEIMPVEKKKKQRNIPLYRRSAFLSSLITVIVGLAAQLAIAFAVYGSLPQRIPTNWIGIGKPAQTMPSWIVFIAFTGAEIILLLITIFTQKNDKGLRVMEWGKSISIILLALLFTVLQASAFRLT